MKILILTLLAAGIPQLRASCDSIINAAIENEITPGAVLCITRNGRVIYEKAYGLKSYLPTEEPMTEETVFDIASLSKCFGTTLSFMKLIEEGKVSLDDPVRKYIPSFAPWVSPDGKDTVDINIRHLMTHTSGLFPVVILNDFLARYGENQPDSLREFIAREHPKLFRPGTDWKYSCPNFIVLQEVLETVTGERLCDYAYRNIYEPLGLKSTMYLPFDREIPESVYPRIAPTELLEDGTLLVGKVHDPTARLANNGNSGNAGLFSCARDLSVLCSMIMNKGKWRGVRILKPETVELMEEVPYPEIGRALGWDVSSPHAFFEGRLSEDRCLCHTGYTGTSVVMDLDRHIAIILLCNRVHPIDRDALGRTRREISDAVYEAETFRKGIKKNQSK